MIGLLSIRLDIKYAWVMPLGVALIIAWHYLAHALVKNDEDVVLKNVCEAKVLEKVLPNAKYKKTLLFGYYFLAISLLANLGIIMYVVNHAFTI